MAATSYDAYGAPLVAFIFFLYKNKERLIKWGGDFYKNTTLKNRQTDEKFERKEYKSEKTDTEKVKGNFKFSQTT